MGEGVRECRLPPHRHVGQPRRGVLNVESMPAAPETVPESIARWFDKIWGKFYYPIAGILFLLICWASERYGPRVIVRGAIGLIGLLGVAILLYAWRCFVRAEASTAWRPVEARIVTAEVTSELSNTTAGSLNNAALRSIRYFYPRVSYQYDVEGLTYTSDRIILVNVNYSQAEAQALVARYPAGSRATALVDPGDPRTAVLEPGVENKGQYAVPAIVGAVFLVAGGAGWFLIFK